MKSIKSVTVPRNILEHCEVDPRGLPVPFVVLKDSNGIFHFKINDSEKTLQCIMGKLCTICGQKMKEEDRWLVGGIASAYDERGGYIDHPIHKECAVYALQVCPYLASRNYNWKPTDLEEMESKISGSYKLKNATVDPDKVPFFVLIRPDDIEYKLYPETVVVVPTRPYHEVEFWDCGVQVTDYELLKAKIKGTKWEKYSKTMFP